MLTKAGLHDCNNTSLACEKINTEPFGFQFVLWHQTLQRLRHIYPTYVPIFNRLNLTRVPEFHHACIMNMDFHVF